MEGNVLRSKMTYQFFLSDNSALILAEDFERERCIYHMLGMTGRNEVGVDTKAYTESVSMGSSTGDCLKF